MNEWKHKGARASATSEGLQASATGKAALADDHPPAMAEFDAERLGGGGGAERLQPFTSRLQQAMTEPWPEATLPLLVGAKLHCCCQLEVKLLGTHNTLPKKQIKASPTSIKKFSWILGLQVASAAATIGS